jgi:hypothetical protein
MQEEAVQINVSDKVGLLLKTLSRLSNKTVDEVILKALNLENIDLGETSSPSAPVASTNDGIFRTREAELSVGLRLRKVFKGQERNARIEQNGIRVEGIGSVFQSPSLAAVAVTGYNTNGWTFWDYWDEKAEDWKPLDALRNQSLTAYEKLRQQVLQRTKAAAGHGYHVAVPTLANECGIDEIHVQQRLVRWHKDDGIIRLEKFDEHNRIKPLDQWTSEQRFFTLATDGGNIRIHMTDKGDELLQRLLA